MAVRTLHPGGREAQFGQRIGVDLQDAQFAARQFLAQEHRRDHAGADAVLRHPHHHRHRGAAVHARRRHAGARQHVAHHAVWRAVGRIGDDRQAADAFQRQGLGAQFQQRAGDPGQRIGAQRQVLDPRFQHRPHQEGQVDLARHQVRAQHMGGVHLDLQHQRRIRGVHQLDQRRQPGLHDGLGHADAHRARHHVLLARGLEHVAPHLQHAFGVRQQFMALGGQLDAAGVTLEQAHAQIGLERGDALRYRRLRGVELVGRGAEAAQRGDPKECFYIA
ncbi:Uncharacterised protein [Achromobacter xylosoxidans]|nr:Uncharacterised protein [Achromobacter xylosoxidans]